MLLTVLKSKLFVKIVSIFDVLFALIIVAPLVVVFWSTTWKLYDLFISPNEPVISGTVSCSFGFVGQMILMYHQESIQKLFDFGNRKFLSSIVLKIYALFLGHTFVSFWRGVWTFVDATSSKDLGVVVLNIVQNIIILMILRAFRNSLVPPFLVLTDQKDQYRMRTVLETSKANGRFTFFIDCLCTMFVEMLVAFIWHDLWYIHDSNLLPDDLFYSASSSLLIGYSLALICFTMQNAIGILCEKHDEMKVVIYDVFMLICLLSAVNVWRGVWSYVTYFAGSDKEWNIILNTLAWSLLMIVNCTFSLSAKDVLKDAEMPGRSCTKFQTQFFLEIIHENKEKKSDEVLSVSTQVP